MSNINSDAFRLSHTAAVFASKYDDFKLELNSSWLTTIGTKKALRLHSSLIEDCLINTLKYRNIKIDAAPIKLEARVTKKELKQICKNTLDQLIQDLANNLGITSRRVKKKWISGVEDLCKLGTNALESSGYVLVDKPQPNDLVVYLSPTKQPTHFGLFKEDDKVESIWGRLPYMFLHPILSTPYGSSYQIFRKKA